MNYLSKLKMTLKSDNPEGFKSLVADVIKQKRDEALANAVKEALERAMVPAVSSSGGLLSRLVGY